MKRSQPLLEIIRGSIVESAHYGSIAVVDAQGNLLKSYGDPYMVAFLRSSAKQFQALPFVEHGGVEHYNYTKRELSLSCASHEGARIHLEAVKALQEKTGIKESDLQCGGHLPDDPEMLREYISRNIKPSANDNNCSGKHTTMLAHAKMRGLPLDTYLDINHVIQQEILACIADMCRIEKEKIELGTDGCSAPNFAMPLFHAALGMARMCNPRELSPERAAACGKIIEAMIAHPEMASGMREFDRMLITAGNGNIITKRGAEGYQIIGLIQQGIGIALKVEDGDPSRMSDNLESTARVRPAVTIEILRQLGVLNQDQLKILEPFGPEKTLRNYAGLVTGKSRPAFTLA